MITLLFGTGTVYAYPAFGNALSDWYSRAFEKNHQQLKETMEIELKKSLEEIPTYIRDTGDQAKAQLIEFQTKQTAATVQAITDHKNHYLQDLQAAKEPLIIEHKATLETYKQQKMANEAALVGADAKNILKELLENLD
ncbi:hypothetical protein [Bacillus sp. FJAT-27445]|uniref:hypothetical protein n=1 Tax=Bacillus sp. FJAT-27445 TaxID=1679166 RepID=UPI000743685C|nr:hypothetical protein [Bacillus sp. FJAT-27445]